MRIRRLSIRNIGPFVEADMQFFDDADEKSHVVLITGENGTGKSIILDAIRGMFGPKYGLLDRNISRKKWKEEPSVSLSFGERLKTEPFISLGLEKDGTETDLLSSKVLDSQIQLRGMEAHDRRLADVPEKVNKGDECPNWITEFWSSASALGSYKISSIVNPQHKSFLVNSLQGIRAKEDITQLICHFDYVRDSREPHERATGERLYELLEKIIEISLLDGGRLSHVSRSTYEPVIIQNGQSVTLENLSSGNLYIIQNMLGLLGKMYSVHFLRQTPLSELCQTPGLLLIDEAENQLHPKWQKRFIRSVLEIFPNLQIIATTHSPFIISSVPNAQLFVCKAEADHCVVSDETAEYSNKPVDEILMSPLFEATLPFNEEISRLMKKRAQAVMTGDYKEREQIDAKLKEVNPQYFSYLDVDKLLDEIKGGGQT